MKFFFTLLILLCFFTRNVIAATDVSSDDSCLAITTPYSVFGTDTISLGLFATYSYFFTMIGVDCCSSTCQVNCSSNDPSAAACDTTQTISFNFTSSTNGTSYSTSQYCLVDYNSTTNPTITSASGGQITCQQYQYFSNPPAIVRGFLDGNYLCVQFLTPYGFQSIGCKTAQNQALVASNSPCYAGQSCENGGTVYSRTMIPLTALVIQCMTETLATLFNTSEFGCADSAYNISTFSMFQYYMIAIIRAVLMLYIILFGMKTVLSSDTPKSSEGWIFFTKIILVLYFSVGLPVGTDDHGQLVMQNGITTIVQPFASKATYGFAQMMYNSVNGEGSLCYFDSSGYEQGYAYLAIWDSLDCRVLMYLNIQAAVEDGVIGIIGFEFFGMFFALFLSFQIMFLIMCVIFATFFFSIIVFFCQTVVTALICVTILCYFAPIFVPFSLFQVTKGYFDAWVKLLLSYVLQPMIITSFIALTITIYDTQVFGTCSFTRNDISTTLRPAVQFVMNTPSSDSSCNTTWGYLFGGYGDLVSTLYALFIPVPLINPSVVPNLFDTLVTLTMFGFLFYIFVGTISAFAGELSGGVNIGKHSIDPMAVFNLAIQAAKAYMNKKMPSGGGGGGSPGGGGGGSPGGGKA